jgi:subfamily B ATP-binding cassette protein MsbA
LPRILSYLRPYKKRIVVVFILMLVISVLTLMDAWLMGRLTDAIFYRSKGLTLSLGAVDKVKSQPLTLNFSKLSSQWTAAEQNDLTQAIRTYGINVRSVRVQGGALVARILVSDAQADDPLKLARDLRNHLQPKFGHLQVSLAVTDEARTHPGWVLFSKHYTIYILPVVLLFVYIIRGLSNYAQSYLVGSIGQKIMKRLRDEIYSNLLGLSISYFERNKTGQTGQLISRITGDIEAINFLFTSGIFDLVRQPITVILGLTWAFILNWQLALMFFLIFPLIIWPVNHLNRKLKTVSINLMNSTAEMTGLLQEILLGVKVVKAFGMENHEIERFKHYSQSNYRAAMRALVTGKAFSRSIEILVAFAIAIFLTVSGNLILHNSLSPSEFYTFIFLMAFITNPVRSMSEILPNVPKALAASDRIFELIDQRSEVVEAPNPIDLPMVQGKVEFDNVSFSYNKEEPVLQEINLKVEPGEVIALVGPSGAGKTTMVNLVARFYDPVSGMIKIDGHDLREIRLASLRAQMGIVPQETSLFRGTIAENIAYGKLNASLDEIVAAAEAANAHQFITQLVMGYQTAVGAQGITLSGGQRQRIAIARALLRDPRILILDEATSALDTQSEVLVQEALQRLMKNRTCFVIAHRLSTIRTADRIVVLQAGQIVEVGTHQELLAQDGLYSLLYHTQYRNQEGTDQ